MDKHIHTFDLLVALFILMEQDQLQIEIDGNDGKRLEIEQIVEDPKFKAGFMINRLDQFGGARATTPKELRMDLEHFGALDAVREQAIDRIKQLLS